MHKIIPTFIRMRAGILYLLIVGFALLLVASKQQPGKQRIRVPVATCLSVTEPNKLACALPEISNSPSKINLALNFFRIRYGRLFEHANNCRIDLSATHLKLYLSKAPDWKLLKINTFQKIIRLDSDKSENHPIV